MLPTEWRGASDESVKEQYAQRQAGHKQGDHDAADGEDALEIGVLGGDPFGVAEDEACAGGGAGSGHGSGQAKDQQSGDDLGISADEAGKLAEHGGQRHQKDSVIHKLGQEHSQHRDQGVHDEGALPGQEGSQRLQNGGRDIGLWMHERSA